MPVGMAGRPSVEPGLPGLAAVLALCWPSLREGRLRALARAARPARPTGRSGRPLLLLRLAVLSLSWSAFPRRPLWRSANSGSRSPCAFLLALTLPAADAAPGPPAAVSRCRSPSRAVLILVELAHGLAWRRALGAARRPFIFNRPVLTILVGPPAGSSPLLSARRRPARPRPAAGLAAVAWFTIARSESGAAELGLSRSSRCSRLAASWRRASSRVGRRRLRGRDGAWRRCSARSGDRLIPTRSMHGLADSHSPRPHQHLAQLRRRDPRAIPSSAAASASARAWRRPRSRARRSRSDRRTLLGVGHPHNAAVQIWAELGVVGAVLPALMLCLQTLARASPRLPRLVAAASLALVAGAAAVALVGHGAWQGWWAAAIGRRHRLAAFGARRLRQNTTGDHPMSDLRRRPVRHRRRVPAGCAPARIAAGYGARVMVAEEHRVGGTCVIRGCVPKKLLVYASRFADEFDEAAGFGWTVPEAALRLGDPDRATRTREIARLEGVYRANLEKVRRRDRRQPRGDRGCPYGPARAHRRAIRARFILVAVGAHPTLEPPIPGGELAITSNEVFHLERCPSASWSSAAATSRSSSPASSPGSAAR